MRNSRHASHLKNVAHTTKKKKKKINSSLSWRCIVLFAEGPVCFTKYQHRLHVTWASEQTVMVSAWCPVWVKLHTYNWRGTSLPTPPSKACPLVMQRQIAWVTTFYQKTDELFPCWSKTHLLCSPRRLFPTYWRWTRCGRCACRSRGSDLKLRQMSRGPVPAANWGEV